jgi:hypothetical protein
MFYQAIDKAELTPAQESKISKNPISIVNQRLSCNNNITVLGASQQYMQLTRLVNSLDNEKIQQFPTESKRVKTLLLNSDNALIKVGKILNDIEVGVIKSDWEADSNIADIVIISGRHRLVALLTWCAYSGLKPNEYMHANLKVIVKVVDTIDELPQLIIAANDSRNMTKSELTNMKISSVSDNTIEDVCENYKVAKISFAAALSQILHLMQQEEKCYFKNFKGNKKLLTSDNLKNIATRYCTLVKIPKSSQTPERLLEIALNIREELPKCLSKSRFMARENITSHSFVKRVSEKLAADIVI